MLRPESDVVSDICVNHVLIVSHFKLGVGVLMLWWSVHMYMPTKMGQFFKPSFHSGGLCKPL